MKNELNFVSENHPGLNFRKQALPKMKEYIKMSLVSVKSKLNKNFKRHCFSIYGYDFILDQNLKPWIIEVNTNPCIEESSELLKMYIPRMIDDSFKLTVDILYPLQDDYNQNRLEKITNKVQQQKIQGNENESLPDPPQLKQRSKYSVQNYTDYENMWEYYGQY